MEIEIFLVDFYRLCAIQLTLLHYSKIDLAGKFTQILILLKKNAAIE